MSSSSKNTLQPNPDLGDSTLRPRTARLLSFLGDEGASSENTSKGQTTSTSASASISSSINTTTTKRTSTSSKSRSQYDQLRARRSGNESRLDADEQDARQRGSGANGLWDSWTQIQGIASTLLGNEASAIDGSTGATPTAWMRKERNRGAPKTLRKWGPRAPDIIGTGPGMIEDRQAMLQASRREALLLPTVDDRKDSSGKYKRKDSDGSLTIRPTVQTEDALVYRHKVLPNDTMAGVTIKYSCQAETFRKVNRLWPNDRIQIRDHVLLPVEACAIRGRKVDEPDAGAGAQTQAQEGLLSSNKAAGKQEELANGISQDLTGITSSHADMSASSAIDDANEEYQHDSWVALPNFPHAVEILRMPRAKLGYFPTARRKSTHHIHTSVMDSALSSPRTSFDTLRHPPSHAAQQAQLLQQTSRSVSAGASPVYQRPRATTSSSISSQGSKMASTQFFSALRGPGGVGSLKGMGARYSRPGPPDDALNQNFQKYLPSLAIVAATPEDDDRDDTYLAPVNGTRTMSFNSLALPRVSTDSLRSTRSGRSNSSTGAFTGAGVTVEKWVKKLASTGAASLAGTRPSLSRNNSDRTLGGHPHPLSSGIGIGGETGLGDLIELETNSNLNSDLFLSDDLHNPSSSTSTSRSRAAVTQNDGRDKEVRESQETNLLDERFPIRGRISTAYTPKKR